MKELIPFIGFMAVLGVAFLLLLKTKVFFVGGS